LPVVGAKLGFLLWGRNIDWSFWEQSVEDIWT
jgi:hypothetical protein